MTSSQKQTIGYWRSFGEWCCKSKPCKKEFKRMLGKQTYFSLNCFTTQVALRSFYNDKVNANFKVSQNLE